MNTSLFQQTVLTYYKKHKRNLPWRKTITPYHVLVSEVMLQQTQVARVLVKFPEFIKVFPTIESLARAPQARVQAVWQGMGYNRRALYLSLSAERVVKQYKGKIPTDPAILKILPGIGEATAASISVFITNKPAVFIETNIRAVFIHHFFNDRANVTDAELIQLIQKTLPIKNPREWYYALMDYGTHLKKEFKNPSRKSAHHTIQKPFKGSAREVRGKIIAYLVKNKKGTEKEIRKALGKECHIGDNIVRLTKEGLIKQKNGIYSL
jgi:A/G-specific adenine glycosylase